MTVHIIREVLTLVSLGMLPIFLIQYFILYLKYKGKTKDIIVNLPGGQAFTLTGLPVSIYSHWVDKKNGISCYSCSDPTSKLEEDPSFISTEKEDFRLCKACEREVRIDNILHGRNLLLKFKKFLLSDRYNKISVFYALSSIVFLIPGFFFRYDIFNILSSLVLISHWSLMSYRNYLNK